MGMDQRRPLVSIGIPTYNRADLYFREALASALAQDYPNLEIIVADNCSTDATEDLVKGFRDSRLKYIRHDKNIGANNNYNFCLDTATGDYFLLLHDDDMIDRDFVQTCMSHVDYRKDLGIIQTGVRVIDSNGRTIFECPNRANGVPAAQYFRAWFAGKTCWYVCNTLYNTRALKEIGGFHSKYNLIEDNVAIVKLASRFERADVEPVLATSRKHGEQLTFAAQVKHWCDDYLALLELMCTVVDNDQALIRNEGMRVLCQRHFMRASAIKSPYIRFLTYLGVHRKFKYKGSLLTYLYYNELLYLLQKTKRKLNL